MGFVRGHFRRTKSGFTYVRPSVRRSSSGAGLLAIAGMVAIGVVISVVVTIVQFMVAHWIAILATLLLGGATFVGVTWAGGRGKQRVTTYLELAREVVHGAMGHDVELIRLSKQIPANDQERILGEEEVYRTLIAEILADGEITDEECERLRRIHEAFVFDSSRALAIRQEAFAGFISWVGVDLTREQELGLRTVAARLEISQEHTEHWLAIVAGRRAEREQEAAWAIERERQRAIAAEQARQAAAAAEQARQAAAAAEQQRQAEAAAERLRAREAERERIAAAAAERERHLQAQHAAASAVFESDRRNPVDVEVKLKRGESCWLSARASLRDRKVTRSGALLVSNKRLLFVADTTVSVPLAQMLDVAADPGAGVLRVVKDGRKTPYEFILDQPLVALAHVERSLQEANG